MKPYTAYQTQVNAAIARTLSSVGTELDASVARAAVTTDQLDLRLTAAHTTTLAQLRQQRLQLEHLGEQSAALSAAVARLSEELAREREERDRRLAAPERLVAESRALPYTAEDVFDVFDAGAAGSVLGFDAASPVAAEEAYRSFENIFRGAETFVADRQRRYLGVIGSAAPVVDIGCGRGEFLDILAEAGIPATGVDSDPGMVARCRAKGHTATVLGDGIAYLDALEDGSLGLVFSAQVAEHLSTDALQRLFALALAKLRPGGLLVVETVNPHSAQALKTFWVDVTHRHPLFPEALLVLAQTTGFASGYVFHPNGTGDVVADRFTAGEYALVARRSA